MNRRDMLKLSSYAVAAASSSALNETASAQTAKAGGESIARWITSNSIFRGLPPGIPLLTSLFGNLSHQHRSVSVGGFYDGGGSYKIRFMPDEPGTWTWTTTSNSPALNGQSGSLQCVAPEAGNRGPVSVRDSFHFGYADGTPFVECGTTCYAWAFQPKKRSARQFRL